jgi:enoyl-CoA hydratase/carnithine racemase
MGIADTQPILQSAVNDRPINKNGRETDMAYETILYSVEEQILTITLNRPDKLNAYNATMQAELIDAFDKADADDNVRAIIITGAGRGFCAGADLSSGAARAGAPSCRWQCRL